MMVAANQALSIRKMLHQQLPLLKQPSAKTKFREISQQYHCAPQLIHALMPSGYILIDFI